MKKELFRQRKKVQLEIFRQGKGRKMFDALVWMGHHLRPLIAVDSVKRSMECCLCLSFQQTQIFLLIVCKLLRCSFSYDFSNRWNH